MDCIRLEVARPVTSLHPFAPTETRAALLLFYLETSMALNDNGGMLNGSASYEHTLSSKVVQSINGSGHKIPTLLSQFLKSHKELESYK